MILFQITPGCIDVANVEMAELKRIIEVVNDNINVVVKKLEADLCEKG